MARYTLINELRSIEFHDSFLDNAYLAENELHLVFSSAIILGHSFPELTDRIPCSVNAGEDRYACPQLTVTFKNFRFCSVLRGGSWMQDDKGNTIAEYPPRNLSTEEYAAFLEMIPAKKNNHVHGLSFDTETNTYTLCFFMNEDANYYEMEFSSETAIAEFEEFGKDAWYLDSKWRNRRKHP